MHPKCFPQGRCGAGTLQAAINYVLLFKGDVWVLARGWAGLGVFSLGSIVGNGNAAVLPRLPVTPSHPPTRAVVTLPSEGRHARASLGFSTYI